MNVRLFSTPPPDTARDCGFDNLKGISIFLVVCGHILARYPMYDTNPYTRFVYLLIYSFHMPLFVFISGRFTNTDGDAASYFRNTVLRILIPYFLFNGFYTMANSGSAAAAFGSLFSPYHIMWYLLSLFCWRLLIFPASRLRRPLVVSILFALLVGLTGASRFLSLSRTVAFFPYFVAGHLCRGRGIERIRNAHRAIPIAGSILLVPGVVLAVRWNMQRSVFYMADSYTAMGLSAGNGILQRTYALLLGAVGICVFLSVMPKRETVITGLGRNTMTAYLLHILVINGMEYYGLMQFSDPFVCLTVVPVYSVGICALFGNRFVSSLYDRFLRLIGRLLLKPPTSDS